MKKDFLTLLDLQESDVYHLIKSAIAFKKNRGKKKQAQPLLGKTLGLIFEKSSTRTRVSFEVAMGELGGRVVTLSSQESQLGRGESYKDTALVLSRYLHALMVRTYSQKVLEELAQYASIPVINGLSDLCHPVQLLADLMTIYEVKKDLSSLKIAYVGDGNNMANSWIEAAILLKFQLNIATPPQYKPSAALLTDISSYPNISLMTDPVEAVKSADVINTDTWVSMGQKEDQSKVKSFAPFQVNSQLITHASPKVMVLHCLPAHRGEEITDEVIDGKYSYVFEEAENRLHVQKALLVELIR